MFVENIRFTNVYLQCIMEYCISILVLFFPFPLYAEIWTNLDAAVLFCTRHNNVTSIFKGQLLQFQKISKGIYPNILRSYGMQFLIKIIWNVEICRRSVGQWQPYCQILILTKRTLRYPCSQVLCLNQWKCDISVLGKTK